MIIDVGHFSTFPCQMLVPRYGSQLLPSFGFGSIGLALPTAIGVAAAIPEEVTLAVLGDGGLLMSLSELETCARLALSLVLLVLNDRAYGAEVHHLRRHGLPTTVAHFAETDFAALASTLGMRGARLASRAELDDVGDLLAGPLPLLLDIRVNPDVVADKWQIELGEADTSTR